ncbi:MAG: hypothetical protein ABJA79_02990 [Parafilimonas sp.]
MILNQFEQVDKLKIGESITVYYYETSNIDDDGINRNVKFIDENDDNYFEAGSSKNILGIAVIFICVLVMVWAYFLWKKNKISF